MEGQSESLLDLRVESVAVRTALQEQVEQGWMAMIMSLNDSILQAVPGAGWDSGLLDSSGHTRPAYGVIAKFLR